MYRLSSAYCLYAKFLLFFFFLFIAKKRPRVQCHHSNESHWAVSTFKWYCLCYNILQNSTGICFILSLKMLQRGPSPKIQNIQRELKTLTTEWTSSILEERRLLIELTNFERCSKCLVISVAITMSMIAWRIVRNSSLPDKKRNTTFGLVGNESSEREKLFSLQFCLYHSPEQSGILSKLTPTRSSCPHQSEQRCCFSNQSGSDSAGRRALLPRFSFPRLALSVLIILLHFVWLEK